MAVQVVKTTLAGAKKAKDGKVPGAIVLLSDGAQTRGTLTPLDGAARARDAGIRVFTVALGTKNGTLGFGGGPFGGYGLGGGFNGGGGGNGGRRFPVRPDPATLAAIAQRDRRQDVRGEVGVEGRVDLQAARLEHRAAAGEPRDLVVVRRRRRAPAPAARSAPRAVTGARLP